MVIKTNLTRWHYFKMQLYLLPRAKSNWAGLFIVWATFFFVFLQEFGFTGDAVCKFCTLLSSFIVSVLYTIVIMLILTALGLMIGVLTVGQFPGALGDHEFMLKEEGLFEMTSVNETLTKWEGISSMTKTKRFIYVRLGSFFHLLPRNSFENQEQFEKFWEDLHNSWEINRK